MEVEKTQALELSFALIIGISIKIWNFFVNFLAF